MKLQTERLLIREFVSNDLMDIHEYCTQKEVTELAGFAFHISLEESKQAMDSWIQTNRKYALVYLNNSKVIGHISIDPDSEEGRLDTRELGFVLNKDYHQRGLMSEAIVATVNYLFNEENIKMIWACCFQDNIASKRCIEKCGFQFMQEGVYYSKSLQQEFKSFEYCLKKLDKESIFKL